MHGSEYACPAEALDNLLQQVEVADGNGNRNFLAADLHICKTQDLADAIFSKLSPILPPTSQKPSVYAALQGGGRWVGDGRCALNKGNTGLARKNHRFLTEKPLVSPHETNQIFMFISDYFCFTGNVK